MATGLVIPVSEYLSSVYRPDCDYVDGELQERNLGEFDHADLQSRFIEVLRTANHKRYLRAFTELRVQVSATRFRVPDVCVLSVAAAAEREQIIHHPPLLCIEILSPRDTIFGMRIRVRDFLDMGVPQVWLVDPATRAVILCSGSTMTEQTTGELTVPATPVTISIAEIFSVLDEM